MFQMLSIWMYCVLHHYGPISFLRYYQQRQQQKWTTGSVHRHPARAHTSMDGHRKRVGTIIVTSFFFWVRIHIDTHTCSYLSSLQAFYSRMSLICSDEVACHLFSQEVPKEQRQWLSSGSKRALPTGRSVAHTLINLLSMMPGIPFIPSHAQRRMSSICQPASALPAHPIMQFVLVWQLGMRPWRG